MLSFCIICFTEFVPNTSDDEGRYSYENQPDVGYFNLNKLRLALASLMDDKRLILVGTETHCAQRNCTCMN